MDTDSSYSDVIYLGSDHNGNAARGYITDLLKKIGYHVVDVNGSDYDKKVDYTDIAQSLCECVVSSPVVSRGILICGTGTGMLIAANRFKQIRAGLATDRATAELMRKHNDCNVLVLGQWRTPLGNMDELLYAFLDTPFQGGRHIPRVEKLEKLGG